MEATYRDEHGEVSTTITNNGKVLLMLLRDVQFSGTNFDDFAPVAETEPSLLATFTLQHRCLCACTIDARMDLAVAVDTDTRIAALGIHITLGHPQPNGNLDEESLLLDLGLGSATYHSSGASGWFEDELLEIERQLPPGTHLKCCITCAFSDYSPAGHGLYGCLACFRSNKEKYLAVKSKADIFRIWPSLTDYVQETYLCPEYRLRRPNTGYRG